MVMSLIQEQSKNEIRKPEVYLGTAIAQGYGFIPEIRWQQMG
jgi:hypothetical protein